MGVETRPVTDVLRLIGLTQDGARLPVLLTGAVVWMVMTVRNMRGDLAILRDSIKANAGAIKANADAIAALPAIATDVGVLRDRAERPGATSTPVIGPAAQSPATA